MENLTANEPVNATHMQEQTPQEQTPPPQPQEQAPQPQEQAPAKPPLRRSTGSAKSAFDASVSIIQALDEQMIADFWTLNRNAVLSSFGYVRTKSADGQATKGGVDYGSASLAKVLKHLDAPKKEGAVLSAAWAMAAALALD